jgi:predicted dehydrogenase
LFLPPMNAIGIHIVDGMIQLVGPVDEVFVVVGSGVPDRRDTANVMLRFVGGTSGTIFCSLATAPVFRFAVYGTKGVAEVTGPTLDEFAYMHAPSEPPSGPVQPPRTERLQFPGFNMLQAELLEFARAISEQRPYPVSKHDILHGVAVLDAVMASARNGKPTKVAQFAA